MVLHKRTRLTALQRQGVYRQVQGRYDKGSAILAEKRDREKLSNILTTESEEASIRERHMLSYDT